MPNNALKDTDITGALTVSGDAEFAGGYASGGISLQSGLGNAQFNGIVTAADGFISLAGYSALDDSIFRDIKPDSITMQNNSQADDGTWSLNTDDYCLIYGTITQATTIGAPTEVAEGRRFIVRVKQGGGGSLTWNSIFRFWNYRSTASATTNDVDHWEFVYSAVDSKWDCVTGPLPLNVNALAGLTGAADKLAYFTGSGAMAVTDLTSTARNLLDDASTSAMRTTLGLAIGTDVQAYDAELAALAGLTSAANKVPRFTGSGTAELIDVAYGTFTPTLTDVANAGTLSAIRFTYTQIGTIVTVRGTFDAGITTTATNTSVSITLPIASNFADYRGVSGGGTAQINTGFANAVSVFVQADATNDLILIDWFPSTASTNRVSFIAQYDII